MKMEIIATFPIQLYISIYSTLRFNFSKAYHVLCRLFQHSVWGDQYSQSYQLHHIVQSELMGVSAFFFFLSGTITNVQLWISMSDEVFSIVCIYIWLDCTACAICHTTSSIDTPKNIFILLYNHVYSEWRSAVCKSRTWSSLHIFFYNTVCLLWHAENDTVNMTYSSLRYVC